MTDLDSRDRTLIDRARAGDEPSDADRRRVRAALVAELGLGAGLAMTTAAQTSAAAVPGMAVKVMMAAAKAATAVVLSGAVAGGGFVAYRASRPTQTAMEVRRPSGEQVPRSAQVTASQSAIPLSAVPSVASPVAGRDTALDPEAVDHGLPPQRISSQSRQILTMPDLPRTDGKGAPPTVSPTPLPDPVFEPPRLIAVAAPLLPRSTIEEETRLLRDGVAALHSGDPARALALFDGHARAHPNGVLTEERWAERVTALCDLGRKQEARAAARTFLHRYPRSPLCARVRASCGERSNP